MVEKGCPTKHCVDFLTLMDITVMGKSTLTSHSKGNKHQVNMKNFNPVSGFFKSNSAKLPSSKGTSNNKIDLMMSTLIVSHAEILWL